MAKKLVYTESSAILSPCEKYRYKLVRAWEPDAKTCLFIGLNPSTADATKDDPTIRRCVNFARDWGYGRLVMLNLFAYRATEPNDLIGIADPLGPAYGANLIDELPTADKIVAAWGSHSLAKDRAVKFRWFMQEFGLPFYHLALTKSGQPSHPLYLPRNAVPVLWVPEVKE